MKLRLTSAARRDLDSIHEWITQDNSEAAERVIRGLFAKFELLATGFVSGRAARFRDGTRLRRLVAHPYLIYFQIVRDTDELLIVRIYHGARRPLE